ncbi:type I-F CRISPR-associated protein Csy2 [Wohlfahrtiimonas chitiniclastica]|uniref:type I-F CRISPR-associated protein Csy2 n=1 Tax=Wohlfahrtiimonas chitiniclastica TaxID=400946 RepID=UPI001BCF43D3|nr:type I-F CRISPR-associated protein Csy2 [Wohlfahrtiimonas chitiniclastica]MBS7820480.1 type I-F CRISPR-associated protein Csy2 [Wohlfahrtiimonas chitiniclastica]
MAKRYFLKIPHLSIHNANALSSPLTIGFPAITSWLGAMHALERHVTVDPELSGVKFTQMAVSCHDFHLHTHKGRGDFVHSIIGTSNPLEKTGSRPAFIEEARCDLRVTLLMEVTGAIIKSSDVRAALVKACDQYVMRMKFASGDVMSVKACQWVSIDGDDDSADHRHIARELMLGNVLVEARDVMAKAMEENPEKDAITILLDHLAIQHEATPNEHNDGAQWSSSRLGDHGWLVPISVGFQALSPVTDPILNQRDDVTPHCFAESILTLGRFVMPHRCESLSSLFWSYHVDEAQGLYLCRNQS